MSDQFEIVYSSNVIAAQYGKYWLQKAVPKLLTQKIFETAKYMPTSGWAFYDDIRNCPVKGPEQIRFCANSAHELVDMGLTHCVVCVNGLAISEWMMKIIVPQTVKLIFVETPEQGFEILAKQGFETSNLDFQIKFKN